MYSVRKEDPLIVIGRGITQQYLGVSRIRQSITIEKVIDEERERERKRRKLPFR
jgi:hypothetical protein